MESALLEHISGHIRENMMTGNSMAWQTWLSPAVKCLLLWMQGGQQMSPCHKGFFPCSYDRVPQWSVLVFNICINYLEETKLKVRIFSQAPLSRTWQKATSTNLKKRDSDCITECIFFNHESSARTVATCLEQLPHLHPWKFWRPI